MSFSVPEFSENVLRHNVPLVSSDLWQSPSLSLFFMALRVLKNTDQRYCRMSLCWGLSDIFPWVDWSYALLGRTPQRRCALVSGTCWRVHDVIRTSLVILTLIDLLSVRLSLFKLIFWITVKCFFLKMWVLLWPLFTNCSWQINKSTNFLEGIHGFHDL